MFSKLRAAKNVNRLFEGEASESDLKRMNGWQSSDSEYKAEYLANLHFLADLEPLVNDEEIQSYMDLSAKATTSKNPWKWAGVAALLMVSVFVAYNQIVINQSGTDEAAYRYVTQVGETKTVVLADGSELSMNSGTELMVSMTNEQRNVMLRRGEAYFRVEKDSDRPFSVSVDGQQVTVLGTSFLVRKHAKGMNVAVESGLVGVHPEAVKMSSNAPEVGSTKASITTGDLFQVSAGWYVEMDLSTGKVSSSNNIPVENYFSWKKGYLEFSRQPLYLVVSDLNRYSPKKIVIEDPEIMNMEVNAVIYIDRLSQSIRDLQKVMPIDVINEFDRIILTTKK
ncbi:FecR domain-containing protein [Porticoccaceae bacterium LTM1]|nr:FecR domain-containing protein [Porticoccaceae bacterium LTM1]